MDLEVRASWGFRHLGVWGPGFGAESFGIAVSRFRAWDSRHWAWSLRHRVWKQKHHRVSSPLG